MSIARREAASKLTLRAPRGYDAGRAAPAAAHLAAPGRRHGQGWRREDDRHGGARARRDGGRTARARGRGRPRAAGLAARRDAPRHRADARRGRAGGRQPRARGAARRLRRGRAPLPHPRAAPPREHVVPGAGRGGAGAGRVPGPAAAPRLGRGATARPSGVRPRGRRRAGLGALAPAPGRPAHAGRARSPRARGRARGRARPGGRPRGMSSLADALESRRIILCVGSGGVGKTTAAAALALEAARRGRRTAVLTVDPSHRLKDALGLSALSGRPSRVSLAGIGARGAHLDALLLDVKRTFDELVRALATTPEQARAVLENRLYQNLSGTLAGTREYMAVEQVYRQAAEG